MLRLHRSLRAWGLPAFEATLKQELAQLSQDSLPLQQALSGSSYVADTPITVILHQVTESVQVIHIRAGIFYQGVIAGCSCADDPTPVGENTEYCMLQLDIDKTTAETDVVLVTE